ncbi:MAG: hypothetical protein HRT35_02170 [Algicola sp.]|nr:hypothetical protein [Algicola sp.]
MKPLKTAKALLLALSTAAGTLGASTAHAENWIPIGMGDMLIFIPSVMFEATKISSSDYQLSWMEQNNATSYKIERLTVDTSVEPTSDGAATIWAPAVEVSTTYFDVHHDITSFDMGGEQTYRLSSCENNTCTELDTVNYKVFSADMANTVPQNFTVTEVILAPTVGLIASGKGEAEEHRQNHYAHGYGYSMISGHNASNGNNGNGNGNGNNGNGNGKNRSINQPTDGVVASLIGTPPKSWSIKLEWNDVPGATVYYITKKIIKNGVVSRASLQNVARTHPAVSTSYNYELSAGVYEFEVSACFKDATGQTEIGGFCGGASTELQTDYSQPAKTNLQARNIQIIQDGVALSDSNVVKDDYTFSLKWEQPQTTDTLYDYKVYGELQGLLATVPYVQGQTWASLPRSTRAADAPHMVPGREFCYKVTTRYKEEDKNGNPVLDDDGNPVIIWGEYNNPAPFRCIQIGDAPVLPAPSNFTILQDPDVAYADYLVGYNFTWDAVTDAEYYQVDRDTPNGSGNWIAVYAGKNRQARQYLTPTPSGAGYRVSACDSSGVCGNYSRLYFGIFDEIGTSSTADHRTPACLFAPTTIYKNEPLSLAWCAPEEAGVTGYKLTSQNSAWTHEANVDTFTLTSQGLLALEVPNADVPSMYSFKVTAIYGSDRYELSNPAAGFVLGQNEPQDPNNPQGDNTEQNSVTAAVDSDNIGTIKGSTGISGGAASYSVPIQLPPGRAGMQPGVSLNYSSNGGNGLVGQGWSLSAGGSISRCATTYAIDGRHDAVRYDNNDKLCLNGQRLIVATGGYGAIGSTYHPEMSPTTKVTLNGDWSQTSSSFTVELGNGHIQYFGNTDDSVTIPTDITVPDSWRLAQTKDLHDNSIIYTYEGRYLKTIHYTGRGDTQGDRVVTFNYETRTDTSGGYRAGGYIGRDKRLTTIITSVNNTTANRYNLGYQAYNGRKSILSSLEQCFGDGTSHCLQMTTFEVQPLATTVFADTTATSKTFGTDDSSYNSTFGVHSDYNGDGKNDLLVKPKYNGFASLYLTSPEDTPANAPIELDTLYNAAELESFSFAKVVNQSMDFNLDGRIDVVGLSDVNQRTGTVKISWYNGTIMDTVDTGVPFNCNNLATGTNIRDCSVYIIDINKDGKMDLLTSSQANTTVTPVVSSWTVYLNTHSGSKDTIGQTSFTQDATLTNAINPIQAAMQVMDIDGDGYDNLVLSQQGKIGRATDGTNVRAFELNLDDGLLEEMPSYRIDMRGNATGGRFVDFNQDGLADYLYAEYDERVEQFEDAKAWRLRINTGDGFVTSDAQSTLDTLNLPIGYHVCRNTTTGLDEDSDMTGFAQTVDYNRDGITDILMPGALMNLSDQSATGGDCKLGNTFLNHKYDLYKWDLWLGKRGDNGTVTFDEAASANLNILAPLTDFNLIDFNGDGYVDVVTRLGRAHMNGPAGKTAPGLYVYQNSNAATDLITEITDGMGLLTQFDYGVLSAPRVNDRKLYNNDFANSIFPNINFTTTDTVVKAMHTTNGFDESTLNTTHFTYSAARFNKEGRGFQGFGVIEEENELAGITTKTTYSQDFPYSGMVEEQLTYVTGEDDADRFISRTLNRKFVQSSLTAPFVAYAEQSGSQSQELADVGVTPIIKTTTYSTKLLNLLGHPTDTSSTVCDGGILSVDDKGDENKTNDTLSFACSPAAPWSKTTSTAIGYKTVENVTKPETVTTTATVNYIDDLMATRDHVVLVVNKTMVYNDNWTVQTVITTDETPVSGDYAKAPPLTQTFSYYGDPSVPNSNNADANGQLYRVTSSSDTTGNDQGIQEARWVQTQYTDDGYFVTTTQNSQWLATKDASAQTVKLTTGQVETTTDANGNVVTNHYDGFNRLIKVSTPGVPDVTSGIQLCTGKAIGECEDDEFYRSVTQQAGTPTSYQYLNKTGTALRTTTIGFNTDLIESKTTYNPKGQVTEQTSQAGTVTFGTYDLLGRPESKKVDFDPQDYTVDYTYAGLTTHMDIIAHGAGNNRDITRTVNSAGKLMTSVDEIGNSTYYRYNAAGLPTVIQGPTGIQTTALYNALGHKILMNDPNQGDMHFSYNALGELRKQTDAVGTTLRFNYDKLGRMTSRTSDKADEVALSHTWVFDQMAYGTLSDEQIGNGTDFAKSYGYDTKGRMTSVTTWLDGAPYTQSFEFDPAFGRLKAMHHPDGETIMQYSYNNDGFPISESTSDGKMQRTIIDMDHNGLLTEVGYGNGLNTKTQRTTGGAITSICATINGADCLAFDRIQHIDYQNYDSFGNLGKRINHSQQVTEEFAYDLQDRLTETQKSGYNGLGHYGNANVAQTVNTHYRYDDSGNLTKKSDFSTDVDGSYVYGSADPAVRAANGNAGPNAVRQVTLADGAFGLPASGRTMSLTYDNNGNLLTKTITLVSTGSEPLTYRSMVYNSNNKPIEITNYNGTTTRFEYGSDGLRYKQISPSKTTYYIGGGIYEIEEDTSNSETTKRSYIGDFGLITLKPDLTKEHKYLHRDRLGSIDTISNGDTSASIFDLAASLAEQRSFNAFGKARTAQGAIESDGTEGSGLLPSDTATPRGFTNHEHLGDSGIIHMNGRAYDPDLGRFLSVDPLISDPSNGQTLNPYSYVRNNPLKYTDPSGYTEDEKDKTLKEKHAEEGDGCSGDPLCAVIMRNSGNGAANGKSSDTDDTADTDSLTSDTALAAGMANVDAMIANMDAMMGTAPEVPDFSLVEVGAGLVTYGDAAYKAYSGDYGGAFYSALEETVFIGLGLISWGTGYVGYKIYKGKKLVDKVNDIDFSAINPGPLADNLAGTFAGGRYTAHTLQYDTILYRAGTLNEPLGRFFSLKAPTSALQQRIDYAVLPVWPGGGKSPLDTIFKIKIPKGTTVYKGQTGSQNGIYVGGAEQIVLPTPWLINGLKVVKSSKLK